MPVLEDGQLFERYRVIKWLGNGGSGESYEADDRMLMRKVTLKLIHPWTTLPDSARRQFFREMQGIGALNHRFLAPVLDYGEIDGRIYVARRYVSSGSLLGPNGRLWYRPPLTVVNAFKYGHQLAQALYYIHQHGYAHGFLTFTNVLVLRGPNIENELNHAPFLLADVSLGSFVRRFGKAAIEALPVSAAPEQINKRTVPASDQFALAVLLYFWLSGRPPYLGTPAEVEQQKLSATITSLSVLNPEITAEQDEIILRALKVAPTARHASILSFAEALLASLTPAQRSPAVLASPASQPAAPARLPISEYLAAEKAEEVLLAVEATLDPVPANEIQVAEILPTAAIEPSLSALEQLLTPKRTTAPLPEIAETPQPESTDLESVSELLPHEDQEEQVAIEEEATPETPLADVVPSDEPPSSSGLDLLAPRLIISPPYSNNSYEFLLTSEETNVGRAGASDLLLDQDNLTSRHHALIQCQGDRVLIFDKRSNNGVFVNGQKIEVGPGYELVDGDHISIGSYELIFRDTQPTSDPLD